MDIRKLLSKKEDGNTVIMLVGIAVAILILAVIFAVGPLVGYNVDSAITITAGSNWLNTAATNSTELWTQNTPMLAVGALIAIVGVIIAVLMGVAKQD